MALEQLPVAVEKLSGTVKNKRLKRILGSENVKYLVNYGAVYGIKKLQQKSCNKNFCHQKNLLSENLYDQKVFTLKNFFCNQKIFLLSKKFY